MLIALLLLARTTTFAKGFVLTPGRWGVQSRQLIKNGSFSPDQKSTYVLAWEVALELARRAHKPDAPSRLDCVFGCRSLDDAKAFRDRYRAGANIYELAVQNGTPTFIGDFDKISSGGMDRRSSTTGSKHL
jgi:hypothetical protein